MSTAAPPSPGKKPQIDVRTLSLSQLQKLADLGSRRARAELERRLDVRANAPGHLGRPSAGAPAWQPARATTPAASTPAAPAPRPAQSPAPARTRALPPDAPPVNDPNAPAPLPSAQQAMAEQLAFVAHQNELRERERGLPRLLGMVLMAWGVLMLVGALAMLRHGSGAYYLVCGLGTVGVGWLLLRCLRWALWVQPALAALALAWAWQQTGGIALSLIQAAPVLIPAAWLLLRQAREPLA